MASAGTEPRVQAVPVAQPAPTYPAAAASPYGMPPPKMPPATYNVSDRPEVGKLSLMTTLLRIVQAVFALIGFAVSLRPGLLILLIAELSVLSMRFKMYFHLCPVK